MALRAAAGVVSARATTGAGVVAFSGREGIRALAMRGLPVVAVVGASAPRPAGIVLAVLAPFFPRCGAAGLAGWMVRLVVAAAAAALERHVPVVVVVYGEIVARLGVVVRVAVRVVPPVAVVVRLRGVMFGH